ncbi:cytosine-C5 specific DNA methylase [Skeletonema marinoi]|uniref:Cytosine-C5 specific DNA methylase n=1 Tax=Skeletonema marinoi TaxID=267567 RepID=A0AAD8YEB0_9STRA|nr:cytosine-C5 specific DNA methylase [Skeletonema marinoi]
MSRSIERSAADAADGEEDAKRRKLCDDSSAAAYTTSCLSSIKSSKGVADGSVDVPKEWVIHIPPRLTKSAYQVLLACHAAPRQWHLEGRFGSRTHVVEKGITNGIPILYNEEQMKNIALRDVELKDLLNTEGVSIVEKDFVQNHRTKNVEPEIDARVHPELEPNGYKTPNITQTCTIEKQNGDAAFTYAEMFAGIGGFGVALEALGGNCIHGDIYEVPDSAFPRQLDLLIVRALNLSQPKAFLLENVPGLLGMKDTLDVIVKAFCGAGYKVNAEVCSARGLTATGRKRLFFVGIRQESEAANTSIELSLDASCYRFPYIPDLKLCSHDILDYNTLDR